MSESAKRKKAREMLSKSGYGRQGGHMKHADEAEDKKLIKKEISKTKLKLKDGGCADGGATKPRADRLARGGKTKHGKGHTTVNVVVGAQHPKPVPVPVPKPVPVPVDPNAMAGAGGPPPGAGPMPPPGGMPPQGFKKGGKVKVDSQRDSIKGIPMGQFKKGGRTKGEFTVPMEDGSGGGLGRLAKAKAYGA